MNNKLRQLTLQFITIVLSFSVGAQNSAPTEQLNIVAGFHEPPYVIQKNGVISGFEVELVASVLANLGYQTEFLLVPFGRSMKLLNNPDVDGIMTASQKTFTNEKKLSKPYVIYQNVAVSLERNRFNVKSISELSAYTMASFQMAPKVLGEAFSQAAKKSPHFLEISEQSRQLELLGQNKVQMLVMDKNILRFFNRETKLAVRIHSVFPESHYGIALDDEALVKEFDKEIMRFKVTSAYTKLLDKYNMLQRVVTF